MLPVTTTERVHPTWRLAMVLLAVIGAWPAQGQQAAPPTAPTSNDDARRVVYVPDSLKAQLREEIRQEMLAQVRQEKWAAPDAVPAWTRRFKLSGDLRARYDKSNFAAGNANDGILFDFNAINSGSPMDVNFTDPASERYLNVDRERTRPRLRARLNLDIDLGQRFTSGVRLASGDGSSPVSTNQTLGGSGGGFSKYQFWLDRAFLQYEPFNGRRLGITAMLGRFENPFFATDLIWDEDLNFDGIAVQARSMVADDVQAFLTIGLFPVFTTAFSFPAEQPSKAGSLNKWLWALQLGAGWEIAEPLRLKLGAAYYYYDKIEGRTSSPCATNLKGISCDTDESRPSFAQKGNTYRPLRTPSDVALQQESASPLTTPRYQYFGLASHFREVVLTARIEYDLGTALMVSLDGEAVRNIGFSKNGVAQSAINNFAPSTSSDASQQGSYSGGDNGYLVRLKVGSPTQNRRWDWNVSLTYRYLETDAVVDGFTDSDFGLGGTNLKGFIFGGGLRVADSVATSVRWMSADSIIGPPFKVDALQVDVSARF